MMNFTLTEEQKSLQDLCRDFCERHLKPVAAELDRKAADNPGGCFPWDALKEFSSLGLKNLPLPEGHGGADMGVLTHCVLLEELAAGEAGFAAAIHQSWKLTGLLLKCGTEGQIAKYIPKYANDGTCLVADGTDTVTSGSAGVLAQRGAEGGSRVSAVREGAGWVLNGTKRFMACGGIGAIFFVEAGTDGRVPDSEGVVGVIVTKDVPGFRIGRADDKMGARLRADAEVIFDRCRVPDADVLYGGEGNGAGARERYFASISPAAGALAVGIARAAFEDGIEYAGTRIQGGKPIVEHDAVRFRIAEMAAELETARALIWRTAWHADHDPDFDPKMGLAATLFASEMAPRVCDSAVQIHGGYGYMREYPVEKHWRDSLMCYTIHGMDDITRLKIGRLLNTERI